MRPPVTIRRRGRPALSGTARTSLTMGKIHEAAMKGDIAEVTRLLDKGGALKLVTRQGGAMLGRGLAGDPPRHPSRC